MTVTPGPIFRFHARACVKYIGHCHIALLAVLLFQRCKAAAVGCWPRESEQLTQLSCRYLAAAAADDGVADEDGGGGSGRGPTEGRWYGCSVDRLLMETSSSSLLR